MVSMTLPCLQDGVLPSFSLSPRYQTEAADVTKDSKGLYSTEKILPILSSVRLPEPKGNGIPCLRLSLPDTLFSASCLTWDLCVHLWIMLRSFSDLGWELPLCVGVHVYRSLLGICSLGKPGLRSFPMVQVFFSHVFLEQVYSSGHEFSLLKQASNRSREWLFTPITVISLRQ